MNPLDVTSNNTPIGPEGGVPGISCGCGGKNKGACGSKTNAATGDCGCNGNCRCRKKSCCAILMTLWVLILAGAIAYAGWSIGQGMHHTDSTSHSVID